MKKIYTVLLGMMIITSSFAQQQHRCASMEVDARLKATDPEYAAIRNQIDDSEHLYNAYMVAINRSAQCNNTKADS